MSLIDHADRELRLAGITPDPDIEYGGMLYDSVTRLVTEFAQQGHSGFSAGQTIGLLEKLLRFEVLTPITSDPSTWMNVGEGVWQSRRQPDCFSDNGGKTWRFLDSEPQVGDHVYHHPSGEYLGVVTESTPALVHFDGPRVRDGQPVTIAGHDEVRIGEAP